MTPANGEALVDEFRDAVLSYHRRRTNGDAHGCVEARAALIQFIADKDAEIARLRKALDNAATVMLKMEPK